jgi:hypothetical protein
MTGEAWNSIMHELAMPKQQAIWDCRPVGGIHFMDKEE